MPFQRSRKIAMKIVRGNKEGRPTAEEEAAIDNLLDPRQKLMWEAYINPKSKTFTNAYACALAAGYTPGYSRTITSRPWFKQKLQRMSLLSKAERVFVKTLDMETKDKDTGKEQADLLRIQADVAKHISKTLGKDEGYSERSELTGQDGSPIVFIPAELYDKYGLSGEKVDLPV